MRRFLSTRTGTQNDPKKKPSQASLRRTDAEIWQGKISSAETFSGPLDWEEGCGKTSARAVL